MLADEVKDFLRKNEDKKNAIFQRRILVTDKYIYGLKTGVLEEYAKELVKRRVNIEDLPLDSFEEVLLAGMVLARSKMSKQDKIKYLDKLIVYFDNWAHCDMIVSRLKGLESEREYFEKLLLRENPFEKRVGIIYLMCYFVRKNARDGLDQILSVKDENYYVKMAQAWTIAEAGIRDFEYIFNLLPQIEDKFLRNKSISKMCDSFRITKEQKFELKKLRL